MTFNYVLLAVDRGYGRPSLMAELGKMRSGASHSCSLRPITLFYAINTLHVRHLTLHGTTTKSNIQLSTIRMVQVQCHMPPLNVVKAVLTKSVTVALLSQLSTMALWDTHRPGLCVRVCESPRCSMYARSRSLQVTNSVMKSDSCKKIHPDFAVNSAHG